MLETLEAHPKHPASDSSKRARTAVRNKARNLKGQVKTRGIMDMPLEIFTEISYYVLPADLISLSRTCKAFRNVLMRRSAEKIWANAENYVIGFPPCPWANISKPRFAALVFTRNCTSCGVSTSSNADPFLLVRLCSECRETMLVAIDDPSRSSSEIYPLVPRSNQIHFKKKDAKPRSRGLGLPKYSLLLEFEEIQKMFKVLSQSECTEEFERWKEELIMEVDLRHEFGRDLQDYFEMVDEARSEELEVIKQQRKQEIMEKLRALGWTDRELIFPSSKEGRWSALVEQPRALTDRVWSNLLPKLTPLLEENRKRLQKRDEEERQTKRLQQLHRLLRDLDSNTSVHPLGRLAEALIPGYSTDESTSTSATAKPVSEFLADYPFPDTPTVLAWHLFDDIKTKEMEDEQIKKIFEDKSERLKAKISFWRFLVERNLANRFTQAGEDSSKVSANYNVTINGTTELTNNLPRNARLLLRADSVFSRRSPDSPDGQGGVLYYPEFVYKPQTFWSSQRPYQMTYEYYHPHVEGQRVVKSLLRSIGKPDVAYLELVAMGNRFVCGRCYSHEGMNWKGIVRHYLDELHIWDVVHASKPRFKTKHPIIMLHVHDLDGHVGEEDPFIRILTETEATKRHEEASTASELMHYCALCRNHGRSYAISNLEAMGDHLWNVHFVGLLEAKEGVHYGRVDEEITFLEVGGIWRDEWDKYYDERIRTIEDDWNLMFGL